MHVCVCDLVALDVEDDAPAPGRLADSRFHDAHDVPERHIGVGFEIEEVVDLLLGDHQRVPRVQRIDVEEGEVITLKRKIPNRWDDAIDKFSRSKIFPQYLGEEYCRIYALHRRDESRRFHNIVSNADFDWYMRAV